MSPLMSPSWGRVCGSVPPGRLPRSLHSALPVKSRSSLLFPSPVALAGARWETRSSASFATRHGRPGRTMCAPAGSGRSSPAGARGPSRRSDGGPGAHPRRSRRCANGTPGAGAMGREPAPGGVRPPRGPPGLEQVSGSDAVPALPQAGPDPTPIFVRGNTSGAPFCGLNQTTPREPPGSPSAPSWPATPCASPPPPACSANARPSTPTARSSASRASTLDSRSRRSTRSDTSTASCMRRSTASVSPTI